MVTAGAPGFWLPAEDSEPVDQCQRASCSSPAVCSRLSAAQPQTPSSTASPGALAAVRTLGPAEPWVGTKLPTVPALATPR